MIGSRLNLGSADVAIVTSYPRRWEHLAAVTNALKEQYASKWGYHFFSDCSDVYATEGPKVGTPILGFIKLDMLLYYLQKYETVVWIDADALITNRNIQIEDFLIRRPDKDVILGYDNNGFHSTVIFARNTPTARDYLHAANTIGRQFFIGHPWHEMEALRYFWLAPNYHDRVGFFSAKEICPILKPAYAPHLPMSIGREYAWAPGDWLLHLSALPDAKRLELAQLFADPSTHQHYYDAAYDAVKGLF